MAMPRLKLTERSIVKMEAPDPSGRQQLHWDTELKGFAVLCSGKSNNKTFIVQRDLPSGLTRRLTVGAVNELTLKEASKRATDMLDDLRRGRDPKRKSGNETLREIFEKYLKARPNLRPASIRGYRIMLENYLTSWLDKPLRSITGDMVEDRHRAIAAEIGGGERHGGTFTANAAMRTLRVLWNYAADLTPDLPPNPVRRLRRQWYAEPPRERIVRADDLPRFYASVCALPSSVMRDYILLMLFYWPAPVGGGLVEVGRHRPHLADRSRPGGAHQGRAKARPADVGLRARPSHRPSRPWQRHFRIPGWRATSQGWTSGQLQPRPASG